MNIFLFSRALPFHGAGGMELVAWDLAAGLASRGHNLKVFTTVIPDGVECTVPASLSKSMEIVPLDKTRPGHYSREWWTGSRRAFVGALKNDRPDVILSISAGACSVLPLALSIPSVIQAHGTSIMEFISKVRRGTLISVLSSLRNLSHIPNDILMFRRVSKVVAVGPEVYRGLRNPLMRIALPPKKIEMIPNGIDTLLFRPDASARANMREKFGIPARAKVLCWVSRLHAQKGCHLALKAFSMLRKKNCYFLVVGDGPEVSRLKGQSEQLGVSDRVVFAGRVQRANLPLLLSAGDAFVFTTLRDEGLPLNVLEAMAFDLPCVISLRLCNNIEGIQDVNGIYPVDPMNPKKTADGLESALANETGRVSLKGGMTKDASRAFVKREYSLDGMVRAYETLLEGLVVGYG